jgi:hypothetical protein
MSPAFLVAAILVIGWNLALAAAVLFTDTTTVSENDEAKPRTMQWSQETVKAEVGTPAYDIRTAARDGETTEAPARVARSSREVDVDVRYADASVTVMTGEGRQLRHCSVCMN